MAFDSRRALDLAAAPFLLVAGAALSPFLACVALVGFRRRARRVLARGRSGPVALSHDGERFPPLAPRNAWALLRGHIGLVGPRPLSADELAGWPEAGREAREGMRPGLWDLSRLRRRTHIDFSSEAECEAEYRARLSLKADLGILARFALTSLLPRGRGEGEPRLFGLRLEDASLDQAAEGIAELCARREGEPARLAFLNADSARLAAADADFARALAGCDRIYPDGIGLKLAAAVLGRSLGHNLNGTDLIPRLCRHLAGTGLRVFLLGARPGVAAAAAERLAGDCPGLTICGTRHGYFGEDETAAVLAEVRAARPDLLIVAFGAPKQEQWLAEHLARTGARVGVGVGGLLDFLSGRIPRAPQWLREIGGEWIYRLLQEPSRLWRRYLLGNFVFLGRVALARCGFERDLAACSQE